jgi:hypothetical protein
MNENEPIVQNNIINTNNFDLMQKELNKKKDDIFTFITPSELEHVVCSSIWDEIVAKYKSNKYELSLNQNNSFFISDGKYVLCYIYVIIDNEYNINLHVNSNKYNIKNISDAKNIVKILGNYFIKLKELYKYVKENYYLLYPNKLNMVGIYNDLKCAQGCCNCECYRENIYIFDCDENNYFLFSKNKELIKSFKSIEELDACSELECYKYKCKAYYCCC